MSKKQLQPLQQLLPSSQQPLRLLQQLLQVLSPTRKQHQLPLPPLPQAMLTATDSSADGMTLAHHCADSGLVGALELLTPQLETAGIALETLVDGLGRSVLDVSAHE